MRPPQLPEHNFFGGRAVPSRSGSSFKKVAQDKVAEKLGEKLPTVRTVYCMNEAEMVDVALGILIEGRKQEKPLEQALLGGCDKLELSPTHCVALSPPGSGSEEEDNGKEALPPSLCPSPGPEGSDPACSRSPRQDEDILKYVREIFFS